MSAWGGYWWYTVVYHGDGRGPNKGPYKSIDSARRACSAWLADHGKTGEIQILGPFHSRRDALNPSASAISRNYQEAA